MRRRVTSRTFQPQTSSSATKSVFVVNEDLHGMTVQVLSPIEESLMLHTLHVATRTHACTYRSETHILQAFVRAEEAKWVGHHHWDTSVVGK